MKEKNYEIALDLWKMKTISCSRNQKPDLPDKETGSVKGLSPNEYESQCFSLEHL